MSIRIVRLGSPRAPGEGVRLGTVRRPPRGVRRSEYARRDFYDVWLPMLAPSEALLKEARGKQARGKRARGEQAHGEQAHGVRDERSWKRFVRRFKAEMKASDAARTLDLLAVLSHGTQFALGCYCAEEQRCHRSILRELLAARGARIDQASVGEV